MKKDKTLDRVSWDSYFMKIAFTVAERSTCLRHHVGAIIVHDKRILTTGYNGSVSGHKHCDKIGSCLRDELKIESGKDGHICHALHAESNALNQAARYGIEIKEGSFLYCTHMPCTLCAKNIVQIGIDKIYYSIDFPISILHECIFKNTKLFKIPVNNIEMAIGVKM